MATPRQKREVKIFKKSLTNDMIFTQATGLSAADHWAVGVRAYDGGWEFWEVTAQSVGEKHMAVLGPRGFLADMVPDHEKPEWMQRFKLAKSLEGRLSASGDVLPRKAGCFDVGRAVLCGLSDKTDQEIKTWVRSWVANHPNYRMLSITGGAVDEEEVNCQTFAKECVNFLTGFEVPYGDDNEFWRCTVFGTAGISVGVGYVYCRGALGCSKSDVHGVSGFRRSIAGLGAKSAYRHAEWLPASANMASTASDEYNHSQLGIAPRLVNLASCSGPAQQRHPRLISGLRSIMRLAR
eukprot:TRINITY_DN91818_c0_g1_i1.p1 TRINITY_DN91818_c0_g1~~TRINITY_DN91818_c0_g1_i1.p1  ORF type:complete len:303 (-),score=38.45 TRINITY_DN91818_c0_g1_i1:37-918(-)